LDTQIYADIKALEKKVAELQRKLFGDRMYRQVDMDAEPGLLGRLRGAMYDGRRSSAAPTQSQSDNYQIVSEEFPPILEELRTIVEIDVKAIEKKLEDIGAPYTPGRLPKIK
jgi:hypothetical protein